MLGYPRYIDSLVNYLICLAALIRCKVTSRFFTFTYFFSLELLRSVLLGSLNEVNDKFLIVSKVFSHLLNVLTCSNLFRELFVLGMLHSLYPFHSLIDGLKVHYLASFYSSSSIFFILISSCLQILSIK